MLARALRLQIAIEVLLWAGLGAWLGARQDWGAGTTVAVVFSLILLGRALAIGLTFALTRAWRERGLPEQRLGPFAAARLLLGEYAAFCALYLALLPFERLFMGPDRLRPRAGGARAILLIHAYLGNRGSWWRLRRRLEARGHCVATLNLEPVLAPIGSHVEHVARRLDALLRAAGAERATLIGHSMGGLVARAYLAERGAGAVDMLITLGTPHHGSRMARLGIGANAREMEPGSGWLAWLGSRGIPERTRCVSIYSAHDNFVTPQESSRLAAPAENHRLAGIGHLALPLSGEIWRLIDRELDRSA